VINSKVNAMMADGWELVSINSGVESDAGEKDGNGHFHYSILLQTREVSHQIF
jgi:hypothetical protein